jgi:hypothetical protein
VQTINLAYVVYAVKAALNGLHFCVASAVAEPLEWELLCGKTSLLLARVMTELLSALQRLAAPKQVRPSCAGCMV